MQENGKLFSSLFIVHPLTAFKSKPDRVVINQIGEKCHIGAVDNSVKRGKQNETQQGLYSDVSQKRLQLTTFSLQLNQAPNDALRKTRVSLIEKLVA